MELTVISQDGHQLPTLAASDALFGREYNEALVHQLVVAYQANARSGNRKQKDREEVRHSTKKPFKQKGTGRARAGMTSSPLWRGGGRIFPNSPDENFTQKLNRKMYRAGVAVILSQLLRDGRVIVVDDFTVAAPKTRLVAEKLKALGLEKALVVTDRIDDNLALAFRNLPNLQIVETHQADPVSLLRFPKIVLTAGAVAKFEEVFA
jgi:large subunit ribosomal protein L4